MPEGATVADVGRSLLGLAQRHEILRTTYRDLGSAEPAQVVHAEVQPDHIAVSETGERPGPSHGTGRFVMNRMTTGEAFDLTERPPWKAMVRTYQGRPVLVELEVQHIIADAASCDVLHADFHSLLAGETLPVAPRPRSLARDQHSGTWLRKREGSERYLERILRAATELSRIPESNAGLSSHMGALRSPSALAGARRIAAGLGITPSTVLLTAFARCTEEALGAPVPPVYVMSSNRHLPGYKELVASMNQWMPLLAGPVSGETFEQACARIHGLRMTSLRYSCYSADMETRVREQVSAEFGGGLARGFYLNHVPAQDEPGDEPDETSVQWRDLEFTSHPGFFGFFTESGGFTLAVRATWSGFGRAEVEKLLHAMRTTLAG